MPTTRDYHTVDRATLIQRLHAAAEDYDLWLDQREWLIDRGIDIQKGRCPPPGPNSIVITHEDIDAALEACAQRMTRLLAQLAL